MRQSTFLIIGFLALSTALFSPFCRANLKILTQRDALSGLKTALEKGSIRAVNKLGVTDGFFTNPKVKIPLPSSLKKIEGGLKLLGLSQQTDELILAMNRAAEQAVPEAKTLLLDAIKNMNVNDAKKILAGGDDSVTQYFQSKARTPLAQKFLPIVSATTQKIGLAKKYNNFAGFAGKLHLLNEDQTSIEEYVTQKALDGLFLMIAEEERTIRQDPLGSGSAILKKVFGALK